ncbi:MAG: hypothetical protein RLZZ338_1386 [Cyanobacteriota bacterium]|jgi:MFS family permease
MLDPQRRGSLSILFVSALLFWSSLASLLPTLPLYVQYVGGTKQQIGLVMGAFAIGLLFSRRWLGSQADTKGRKRVVLIGTLVAVLAPLCYLFVKSIPLLLVIRAFHGISIAAFTTGYSALVTDISPPNRRGELIGLMSLGNPLGMALGPALGGYVQAWAGYTPLFIISSCLGFLSLICTTQVWEPGYGDGDTSEIGEVNQAQPYWQLLWTPRIRIPTIVLLLIGLVFGTLSTFIPLYIKETGVDLNVGLFYTTAAIASFLIRFPVGRASDRYGRGLFITGGLLSYAISMCILSMAHDSSVFLLGAFLEGCGGGTVIPMTITLISDRANPQERGRLFSLCIGGFDLGMAIAGPTLGFIAELVGYRNMFILGTGLGSLATLIFITFSSKDIPHSLRFALGQGKDVYAIK